MAKNLDITRAAGTVAGLRADQLGGLLVACRDKMVELGVRNKARTAISVAAAPSANGRGLVEWVVCLCPPVDTCALDKAYCEAAGKKYKVNKIAAARYTRECELFDAEKKKLQALTATVAAKFPG